jgi:hypothetical protein
MRTRQVTVAQLLVLAGTRVALGAGIGLLLGSRLNEKGRQGAGWSLLTLGAVTTIPLAINLIGRADST